MLCVAVMSAANILSRWKHVEINALEMARELWGECHVKDVPAHDPRNSSGGLLEITRPRVSPQHAESFFTDPASVQTAGAGRALRSPRKTGSAGTF